MLRLRLSGKARQGVTKVREGRNALLKHLVLYPYEKSGCER